jgi:hypothetical protein
VTRITDQLYLNLVLIKSYEKVPEAPISLLDSAVTVIDHTCDLLVTGYISLSTPRQFHFPRLNTRPEPPSQTARVTDYKDF